MSFDVFEKYNPPIKLIQDPFAGSAFSIQNSIAKACAERFDQAVETTIMMELGKIGVTVDKDELLKALKYDRDQYAIGFHDGLVHRKTGAWIEADADSGTWECSECGEVWMLNEGNPKENNMNYCPQCGARMCEETEHGGFY